MIRTLGLAAALAALALAAAQAQEQQQQAQPPDVPAGDATLRGRLVAKGGASVADALVILYSLQPDGEPGLRSTQSDAKGAFLFEKIAGDPGIVYLVGTRVGGVPYGVRAVFAAGASEKTVEIAVSEPTEDRSRLSHGAARVRVERGCTHVRVLQSQSLENASERVLYIAPERRAEAKALLSVKLPEGAAGFEPITTVTPDALELRDGAVHFWGPLHPGSHEIEWGFGLPLEAAQALRIVYPDGAPQVDLLLPAGASASGPGLAAEGTRTLPSGEFALFAGKRIAPGGALDAKLDLGAASDGPRPRIEEARMWMELDDVALDVSEQMLLRVDGDQALESDGQPLLCVPLPEDAQDLRFGADTLGLGLTRDPSGALALSGPIPPGETPLALRYRLPAQSGAHTFVRRFGSDVPLLEVFVADTGLRIHSERLHRRRPVVTEDRVYLQLEAFALGAGEEVAISLEPLPARRGPARAFAFGAVAIGAIFAGAFLLAPLRKSGAQAEAAEREEASIALRESLYRAIDALDEDLETEKLSPQDHAEMRAALRARAVELLASEREAQPAAAPPPQPAFCTSCGAKQRAGDRFCSQCGARQEAQRDAAS
jgi:hypothetical protein